jgi:hypothetical protein
MKKVLLITLVLVLSMGVYAQKFSGGLMIGPSIGWLKSDSKSLTTDKARFSYTWGAFIDRNLSDNFALSTGIYINEVGGKIKYNNLTGFVYDDSTNVTYFDESLVKYKVRYIELPISLKGMTNEIGHFKYHLKIGLSPMIKWKAKADIETVYNSVSYSPENVNFSEEVNAFNLAFHVGGGTQLLLGGTTALIAEIVYYNGITDITPDNSDRRNEYSVLSHQIMLRIGVKF